MGMGVPEPRRVRVVRRALAGFAAVQGLSDLPLSHALLEAFCVQGLSGRTSATKGTYRSVLRREAGVVLPALRPRYVGAPAKAPYSAAERAALVAICRAQAHRWRGEAGLVICALGIGAGLRSGEMVAVRGADVVASVDVTVVVTGERARTIRVDAPFAEVVAEAAARVGDDHLLHPGGATRRYHNFVNGLCTTLARDPGAVRLSVGRCRASFICDRLAGGTPLAIILAATGIADVESLLRYARQVEGAPSTKAALRRALAEGR